MSFKNYSAFAFLAATAWLSGCGTKATNPGGAGGSGGDENVTACDLTYQQIDLTSPTVSFANDVMPIFGFSCYQSDCHNHFESSPRAGLGLAPKCQFDATSLKCAFPATAPPPDQNSPDPMIDDPQPLTQDILDAAHSSLLMQSTTAPAVARVVPGDPAHSFLMLKLSNTQGNFNLQCMNQDNSHEGGASAPPCGVGMPQQTTAPLSLCDTSTGSNTVGPAWFETIARWIKQGALEN